jgi:transcriptional regulator with XRE-family HTH domain
METKDYELLKEAIGSRVKELRSNSEEKYTQKKLSQKIWGNQSNGKYLGNIERGEKDVRISTLKNISDALGVSLLEFFEGVKLD